MKNILDKPIKAKTLKKKLEKTLKITKGMKGYGLRKYKIEPFVKGTYVVGHCYDFKNNEIKTFFDKEPLQNNKPSIELIEKLECPLGCGLLTEEQRRNNAIERIENKINEIIDAVNELKTRVNLIDEEDYE